MQEKIKMYLEIENNIFDIKHQLLEYNQLLNYIKYIIGNNYNTNISYNHNYDFYHAISKINHKNITIDNTILNKIHVLNKLSKKKIDLEFLNRQNIVKLNLLKNDIINNISDQKIKKYMSKRIFHKPTKRLNSPETIIYQYLLNLQDKYKEIILIIPQYTLPVKFKKNLYADFFILMYIDQQIFPIIIEYDGIQHYTKNIFFHENRVYCDLIKNNFSIANSISIIRGRNINDIKDLIIKCIKYLISNKTTYYHIPTYKSYFEILT